MEEISKAYEPQAVETKWYSFWQQNDCFTADPDRVSDDRPAYSIVIPPPNVTGVLHMGHVLNNTIQDILARKARMDGKEVLWLPGTDHAGIATQSVVERKLIKDKVMRHRDDLGREVLLKHIWEWKEKHGGIIIDQLKKLGASCDWSRLRFTMDEEYTKCVQQIFVDLYNKGLIYRGKRMVNWCPKSLTALSDEEVIMKEQRSKLYYFKVQVVEESSTWLEIATTRPETIPGDTAIAVNPKDPRYGHLVGKHAVRPLPVENQAHLPIVADEHIDIEFGTGVLKVTPAHDKVDFDIGQRNGVDVIEVISADGKMNELAGVELSGMDRFEARKSASAKLDELGVLTKVEDYNNNVGFSERADVPIEPRLSKQWFLKYPSQDEARNCVSNGAMKFYPERWSKTYDYWMGGLQDWCISRQLWWGHRIPVWYRGEDEVYCGLDTPKGDGWIQDSDVLDTWCSSWLWPFATMGWPDETQTLKKFYPTTDLVTGPDIIFFWVARMIMAGYEWKGDLPFRNVYFTGIIRDKKGRKMSKSLGNSPDPLELISKYGADALRFGTMRSAPLGQDVLFDEKDVELGRNFCNKLWNACRFRQMQGGATEDEIRPELLTSDDRWILLRLGQAIDEVTAAFQAYRFTDATATLYRFFWSEYCDWYIESCKAVFFGEDQERKKNVLAVVDFVMGNMLRLFHPFIPFITEELWHGLGFSNDMPHDQGGSTIMTARWPKRLDKNFIELYGLDDSIDRLIDAKHELVTQGRNLRAVYNIPFNKKVIYYLNPSGQLDELEVAVIKVLLNAESISNGNDLPKGTPRISSVLGDLYLPLEGLIDFEAEKSRLTKEVNKIEKEIEKVQVKLENTNFTERAPIEVLDEQRARLEEWKTKQVQLTDALISLSA
ncbi:MAG: valine--tRNA ligase [Limisphaerales bacterium]|nr:MAG: valine--tRNA ligase [Limisphaerales bacterium]|tara:strand:- start:2793 stop:5456 length:2664 start_codon:yes stop_codon:yes gene_type:complete